MDNKFAVQLPTSAQDRNGFYKKGLMDKIINKYPWLTVAGIDNPDVKHGVEYAGAGNLITFGTAKNHDVNWVRRPDYAREKGYTPIYDVVKDWNTVMSKLDAFAQARKPRPVYTSYNTQVAGDTFYVNGQKIEVYDNFIKIGYNVIPRTKTTTVYATPAYRQQIVNEIVVTVKFLY